MCEKIKAKEICDLANLTQLVMRWDLGSDLWIKCRNCPCTQPESRIVFSSRDFGKQCEQIPTALPHLSCFFTWKIVKIRRVNSVYRTNYILPKLMIYGCFQQTFVSTFHIPLNHILNTNDVHAAAAAAKSLQSCPTLCDPIDDSPPGSPVPGILQTRTLEWAAISFSNAWKWKVKVKLPSCV